ncbi:hypothetical protein V2J09_023097 [Rumex salicifolius]
MDGGDFPWNSRLSTSSRRYQSRSEIYLGDDAVEVEDDYKQEFLCPFCADEFDIVGLCCHVDEEHPVELKQGVCPICAKRVGMDMRRRRLRRGGSSAMFNMLRKELKEASRQSMFGGHSYTLSASNPDLDPLLSSLVYSSPIVEEPGGIEADSSSGLKLAELSVDESVVKRVEEPKLSEKDQEERTRKCEFVQGILLSTIKGGGKEKEKRENHVDMERGACHQEISSTALYATQLAVVNT